MGSEPHDNGRSKAPSTGDGDGESKGKGVAQDEDDREDEKHTDSDSFASRLGNSATGLARSVFQGAPSVHDLANVSASGKTAPSSTSRTLEARTESSSTAAGASHSTGTASFRSDQTEAHVAALEVAFSDFLDNTQVLEPTEPVGLERAWNTASASSTNPANHRAARDAIGISLSEQQDSDGAEVVRLLSQTDEEGPEDENQLTLSEEGLRNLRRALFEDGSPDQVSASDWNNMLNFIPDFLRDQDGRATDSSLMSMGLTDPAEAGQQWLGEWNRVLTSYNDEVWGDLGDLVQQARTEVQTIRDSQKRQMPEPTALRQLRSVLTRVRARL